ncbi:class I SAM-dependent methyltransferase [Sphingomonas sp. I4]
MDWRGRVGDVWAAEWRRTDRSLADLSRHLDEAIASVAPDVGKALDIGSGAGATSLALHAARPGLGITGVDLSDELVAVARERAGETADHGPRFLSGDALTVATAEAPFDVLCSRHGVMFFADPVEALSILRRAARNGARLVFSCFAERAANGFATLADAAIGAAPPPDAGYAPGPFAFSDQQQVAAWLKGSGWRPDGAVRVGFDYVVGKATTRSRMRCPSCPGSARPHVRSRKRHRPSAIASRTPCARVWRQVGWVITSPCTQRPGFGRRRLRADRHSGRSHRNSSPASEGCADCDVPRHVKMVPGHRLARTHARHSGGCCRLRGSTKRSGRDAPPSRLRPATSLAGQE